MGIFGTNIEKKQLDAQSKDIEELQKTVRMLKTEIMALNNEIEILSKKAFDGRRSKNNKREEPQQSDSPILPTEFST